MTPWLKANFFLPKPWLCISPMAGPEEVGEVEPEERGGKEELKPSATPPAQAAPDYRGRELPWVIGRLVGIPLPQLLVIFEKLNASNMYVLCLTGPP